MDATIMPSTPLLLKQIIADFPDLRFSASDHAHWAPSEQTIYYHPDATDNATLLHELSHALLKHAEYDKDIGLIDMERQAWTYATEVLGAKYSIAIDDDIVQDSLDSYRDWLHARSTCPTCSSTGIQSQTDGYKCLACHGSWLVNDARVCALRRYKQSK